MKAETERVHVMWLLIFRIFRIFFRRAHGEVVSQLEGAAAHEMEHVILLANRLAVGDGDFSWLPDATHPKYHPLDAPSSSLGSLSLAHVKKQYPTSLASPYPKSHLSEAQASLQQR